MTRTPELDLAHRVALELLKTIRDYWKLCCALHRGMPADDPRLEEITRLRARVRDGLEQAETELIPQLPEFACVHRWPVTVNGFTASSAHQATLKFTAWLSEQRWTTGGFREFFKMYFDEEKGQINWEAVRGADDRTDDGMREFWERRDWAEHEALLEMEYAKAAKLATTPNADVPELVEIEEGVLHALGDKVLVAGEIALKASYPNNSNFRTRLARMVERGLLEKGHPKGYRKGPLAR